MEAFIFFWSARALLRVLPLRMWVDRLGKTMPPAPDANVSMLRIDAERVRLIGWAVTRIGFHTPLEGTCLPQALAAYCMLMWRGLKGSLHIGVRIASPGSRLEAHAWVRCGEMGLTGFPVAPDFQEIGCIGMH